MDGEGGQVVAGKGHRLSLVDQDVTTTSRLEPHLQNGSVPKSMGPCNIQRRTPGPLGRIRDLVIHSLAGQSSCLSKPEFPHL